MIGIFTNEKSRYIGNVGSTKHRRKTNKAKNTTQHKKFKNSNKDSKRKQNEDESKLEKGRQLLLLIRHPTCYSHSKVR